MKKLILLLIVLWTGHSAFATDSLRILFIGNSYTAVNNLPQVMRDMCVATGHIADVQVSAPGGLTLSGHLGNSATQNLIQQGNWDFVVLQEQSQLPAFPDGQVATAFYPAVALLDSLIHIYSPCAKTVLYMTWGRKFGDQDNCAFFPPICTYEGMDSLLQLRYTNAADSISAIISPVGPVWHYLRDSASTIELYQNDNSHPTAAGTFAAACSFYTIFFGEDPQNIPYDFILSNNDATTVKAAVAAVVFDSLDYWRRFNPLPTAQFTHTMQGDTVSFVNQSAHANSWFWDFGDGQTDTANNPSHVFNAGSFTVCLRSIKGCDTANFCDTLTVSPASIGHELSSVETVHIYPNPVVDNRLYIQGLSDKVNHYAIYDLLGRKLQSGRVVKGQRMIPLSQLSSGVYLLRLSSGQEIIASGKFQKF